MWHATHGVLVTAECPPECHHVPPGKLRAARWMLATFREKIREICRVYCMKFHTKDYPKIIRNILNLK